MEKRMMVAFMLLGGCLYAQTEASLSENKNSQETALLNLKVVIHSSQSTKLVDLQSNFEPKEKTKDCFEKYFGEDRELTKTEMAALGAVPFYFFCNKLGWPFCCLCI